jgi:NADPH2:quinone reductase
VDVVYDPVGGDSFDAAMRSTNWGGRLVVVGFAGGSVPQIPANILLVKNLSALGFYWGSYRHRRPALLAPSFAQMFEWWQEGKLKPRVSGQYDLAEVRTALSLVAERKATGKIVLTPAGPKP